MVSLNDANHLLIITQIYNMVSMAQKSSQAIASIKQLIEQNRNNLLNATTMSPVSFLPASGGGTDTPPSTSSGSQLSAATSSDDASVLDSLEKEENQGQEMTGSGDYTQKYIIAARSDAHQDLPVVSHIKNTMIEKTEDILKMADNETIVEATVLKKQDKKPAEQPVVKPAVKPAKQIAKQTAKQTAKQSAKQQAKQQAPAKLQGTVKAKHDGGHQGAKRSGESDDADDMWQEFSLEEELEGIADAPARSRAAMRAVLREKEEANRRRMRESAEDKRRIAEREGQILKKTFLRPIAPVATNAELPRSYERAKQYNGSGGGFKNKNTSSHDCLAAPEVAMPPPTKHVVESAPKIANPAHVPDVGYMDSDLDGERLMFPYQQHFFRRKKWFPNRAMTEMNSSSGMISVKYASPKNADRFGIVFDPSKLDAETAAEVGGTGRGNDNRRSVLIQNIPHEFSMHKLLGHVRGGVVVMARLVPDTMGAGHGQVAMITFKTAQEAASCKAITAALLAHSEQKDDHPLESETRMSISLLPTPTYPSRETIVTAGSTTVDLVAVEEKTRCIFVTNFPKHFVNDLCTELLFGVQRFPSKMNALEEMWFAGDTLHIQFTSIQEAEKAHRIVSIFHFEKYATQVHFGPDPCAGKFDGGSIEVLFDGSGIKLASHGYMGLKSLLETVGLASFSRSHTEPPVQVLTDKKVVPLAVSKMSFAALLSQARVVAASQNSRTKPVLSGSGKQAQTRSNNTLIDLSFDPTPDSTSHSSVPAPLWDGLSFRSSSAPWTADLMVGLDKL